MIEWAIGVLAIGLTCLGLDRWINRPRPDMHRGPIKVRTVTYGRKLSDRQYGNAELILTADVKRSQTPEEVCAGLRNIVRVQLMEAINDDGELEEACGYRSQ